MDVVSFITSILAPAPSWSTYNTYRIVSFIFIALMFVAAAVAIVLVMLTPGNSNGIDALGGSSETFYGKNKGKSTEAKLKMWTYICLGVLAVLAVVFFILQIDSLWSIES